MSDEQSIIPIVAKEMSAREAVTGLEPNMNLPFLIDDAQVESTVRAYFPELVPLVSRLIGISIIPRDRVRYYHAQIDVTFDLAEASKPEDYMGVSMTALVESIKLWSHLKIDNARDGKLLDKVTRTTRAIEYTETPSSRSGGILGFFRRR